MRFRLPICLLLLALFFPLTPEAAIIIIENPEARVITLSSNIRYALSNDLLVCDKNGIEELYNIRKKQSSAGGTHTQRDGVPSEDKCIFLKEGSKVVFLEEVKKYSLPIDSMYRTGGLEPCPIDPDEYCTYLGEFPDWRYFKVQYLWKEKDNEEGQWYEAYVELKGLFIFKNSPERYRSPDAVSQELTAGESRSAATPSAERAETCPSTPAFLPAEKQE